LNFELKEQFQIFLFSLNSKYIIQNSK